MEITNGLIKWVFSLSKKKNRDEEHCFVAEGTKCVVDTLDSFSVRYLFATAGWLDEHPDVPKDKVVAASEAQIARMSSLKTAPRVLAVYEIPEKIHTPLSDNELVIVLAGIQDPGNLGTIMRVADWYGVRRIFCSHDTVDVYNSKTVQSTMGAIARVSVTYCDLEELLCDSKRPVYGTFLDGDNIYKEHLTEGGFIVMGNEGRGVPPTLERYMSKRLYIPSYPAGVETSESLNVAVATAIVLSEFRRPFL